MHMKKKIILLYMLVTGVLVSAGGGYWIYETYYAEHIEQITKEVTLVYEEQANRNSSFYFKGQKKDETFSTSLFNFEELKDYNVTIPFKGEKYHVTFHIVDTISPVVEFPVREIDLYKGFTLNALYKVSDKTKTEVKTNMKEKDFTEGKHKFCVTAIDTSKNKTEQCTTINVVNSTPVMQQPLNPTITIDKNVSLDTLIGDYKKRNGITNEVTISYHNFVTNETWFDGPDQYMIAGSTYKLPLNLYYYEQEYAGKINPNSKLVYKASDFEAGGPIGDTYKPGDSFTIGQLHYYSLVYSDNTASRILYSGLGGWGAYRNAIKKYSSISYGKEFYENKFTTRYMNDVLSYLYANTTKYPTMMNYLASVAPEECLRMSVNVPIYQKDGFYGSAYNAVGLVYGNKPYAVAIYTSLGERGKQVIGDINNLLYQYSEVH